MFSADCRYNREGEQGIHVAQGEDDDEEEEEEAEDDGVSGASLSSHRSSMVDEAPEDAEFEQKINRLMAAKQKLRQLQDLVAMVQVTTTCFFKKLSHSTFLQGKIYVFDNYWCNFTSTHLCVEFLPYSRFKCLILYMPYIRHEQTFFIKGRLVNIVGFVGHTVSITTTQCKSSRI